MGSKINTSKEDFQKAILNPDRAQGIIFLATAEVKTLELEGLLVLAARAYRGDLVEQLIILGGNIDEQDDRGLTAMHYMVAKNLVSTIAILLFNDAKINIQDAQGRTPLTLACMIGNEVMSRLLIHHGAKIDVKDNQGQTPLMYAVSYNQQDLIRTLLENKQNSINEVDENGYTALRLAVDKGNDQAIQELIGSKAFLSLADNLGRTPLMAAAAYGDQEILTLLVKAGAETNIQDKEGRNALMIAAAFGQTKISEVLIQAGIDVNAKDNDGNSALHLVSSQHQPESVYRIKGFGAPAPNTERILVKGKGGQKTGPGYGTDNLFGTQVKQMPNIEIKNGKAEDYDQLVQLLIQKGLKVNELNNKAETPLHIASQAKHTPTIEYLVKNNADQNVRDANGQIPSFYLTQAEAASKIVTEIAATTVKNPKTAPTPAPATMRPEQRSLSALGMKNTDGLTPLMKACIQGNVEEVRQCLARNPEINGKDFRARTGLIMAAAGGHLEVVEFLVQRGAQMEIKDSQGFTALVFASLLGHINIVESLLKSGAEINVKLKGVPLILLCLANGKLELIELLLKYGANPDTSDYRGATALNYAKANKLPTILPFIKTKLKPQTK